MCGICGIYNFNGEPIDAELLERMTSVMKHRGPDGSGKFIGAGVGLGHRRLSIIDIGGGAQPISNEDNTLQVIFNGEIFNFIELRKELLHHGHNFKTQSDTEVILHGYEEWGVNCVNRFNGMFAFALWDNRLNRLFLARDHLGVKPLYYCVMPHKLLFASEIKSLLQAGDCPRAVDIQSLGELFTFRYVPSPNTLFANIKKLPPANYMLCSAGNIELKNYWQWRPHINTGRGINETIEQYQALLEDTVRLQLRSDVPVGLFLSSGIDSGTLLALMSARAANPIHTFTIGFEDGEKTNETTEARKLASQFGACHHEMMVTAKDYEQYYASYLWDLEEPVGNESAAAFYFVSKIASEQVKVVLSGQGVDEPWAGYHRHIGVKLSCAYSRLPYFLTELFRKISYLLPRNERLKRGVTSLNEADLLTRFVKIYSFYSDEMKEKLFQNWVKQELRIQKREGCKTMKDLQKEVATLDPITQILYLDTRTNLPDDLLMVNDKTSMANSIEARVPYLDYRLVEFVETIPNDLKIKGLQGKYLHKKAVTKWLPREIVHRKKKGFANPVDFWLRGSMLNYVNDCLLSETSAVNRYFNSDYINNLIKLHQTNKEVYMRHIYLLISFELWHQQFIDN